MGKEETKASKKRILILSNSSAGLFNFRQELIIEMAKNNEVYAATPKGDKIKELTEIGCTIIETEFDRRGINLVNEINLLKTYESIIKKINPNIVITYTIKPNIFGSIACQKKKVPYFVNITGLGTVFQKDNNIRKLSIILYRYALKHVSIVFFENEENKETFIRYRIVDESKTIALHGAGINLDRFPLLQYPENDCFHFLFIGRVMKEKGIDELLCAMRKLRQEQYNCCLDIVGGFQENYQQEISNFEKEGWLHYFGYQSDVHPYIQRADCFVLPSYHEGMANTNLECAASGRPIITSDIPGCREAVIENESGFLCKAKNQDSLFQKMKEMIELSMTQRQKMGVAGRKHMEDHFDKKDVVKETLEAIYGWGKE